MNIGKMRPFSELTKMANMKRLKALQNHHFGSKIKIAKKVPKATLEPGYSCSMQKTALKSNDESKNEAILKLEKNGQ